MFKLPGNPDYRLLQHSAVPWVWARSEARSERLARRASDEFAQLAARSVSTTFRGSGAEARSGLTTEANERMRSFAESVRPTYEGELDEEFDALRAVVHQLEPFGLLAALQFMHFFSPAETYYEPASTNNERIPEIVAALAAEQTETEFDSRRDASWTDLQTIHEAVQRMEDLDFLLGLAPIVHENSVTVGAAISFG